MDTKPKKKIRQVAKGRRQMVTLDEDTIARAVEEANSSGRALSNLFAFIIRRHFGTVK